MSKPMKLFFLEAPVPLTKRFAMVSKQVEKTSYPNAYEVTSHEESVTNTRDLEAALKKHAAKAHCLVKGSLNRKLVKESRAGSTDTTESTQLIVLDIDGLPATYQEPDTEQPDGKGGTRVTPGTTHQVTPDYLLDELGLKGVSYVLQWSASYGIENDHLRCHIFLLLDKPMPAPLIKQWLADKNFTTPALAASLSLTKTGNALHYPLDVSACQNDKLIYIAPPVLKGIKDPLGKTPRITLVKKAKDRMTIDTATVSAARNTDAAARHVDRLRAAAGLPKRKMTFKTQGPHQILVRPDACILTDMKTERGFVYFNLNGGDSWGYFHPEGAPDYIHNFKGEPVYLTKELLPEYWASLQEQAQKPNSQGLLRLAFRDRTTNRYYCGTWDATTDELDLHLADRTAVLDHCKANGIPLKNDVIDDEWRLVFDPHDAGTRVDLGNKVVNLFEPTPFMRATAREVKTIPKTIRKVIYHMVGEDTEVFERFINWLAYVLQERDRAITAWLFHGVPGTGKGTLLSKILRPIFGRNHVAIPRMIELEKEFNGFIDRSLLVCVDEVEPEAFRNEHGVMADIRRYTTEEYVALRKMHRDATQIRNYTSWIFFSNTGAAIPIKRGDRRFNVAKFQASKLIITDAELERIPSELQAFHDFLLYRAVDKTQVIVPLNNADRDQVIDIAENAIDAVSNAILEGNMGWLIDQLPTDDRYRGDSRLANKVDDYRNVLLDLLKRTDRNTGACSVARDELRAIFEYTVGNMPESPNKFTARIKHHRIHTTKVWIASKDSPAGGKAVFGIKVMWRDTQDWGKHLSHFAPAVKSAKPQLARVK
jgi:hypothetical protein